MRAKMKIRNRHPHFDTFLMDTEKCISVGRASKSHGIRVKGPIPFVVILNILSAFCGEGVFLPSLSSAAALNWFSAVHFPINSCTTASCPFEATSYSSPVCLLRQSLELQA